MDRTIGENVVTLRGEMSQKALADAMRERGHKWSQATVWAVEKGDRPLKLTEANDLAGVLGTDVYHPLTQPPRALSLYRALVGRYERLNAAEHALVEAVRVYEEARHRLNKFVTDGAARGMEEEVDAFREPVERTVLDVVGPVVEEHRVWAEKDLAVWLGGGADDGEHPEED